MIARLLAPVLLALLAVCGCDSSADGGLIHGRTQSFSGREALPPEVSNTLSLIRRGGPYPYPRDGVVFQNREGRLPPAARGFYREYTVPTPGSRTRGARRIVTGGDPPRVFYYTADHYETFQRLDPSQ